MQKRILSVVIAAVVLLTGIRTAVTVKAETTDTAEQTFTITDEGTSDSADEISAYNKTILNETDNNVRREEAAGKTDEEAEGGTEPDRKTGIAGNETGIDGVETGIDGVETGKENAGITAEKSSPKDTDQPEGPDEENGADPAGDRSEERQEEAGAFKADPLTLEKTSGADRPENDKEKAEPEDTGIQYGVFVESEGSVRTVTVSTEKKYHQMRIAVWSETKQQDDLKWYTMSENAAGVWEAAISLSALKHSGICHIHAYSGNTFAGCTDFISKSSEIGKNIVMVSDTAGQRRITVYAAKSYGNMRAAVWSRHSKQDDLVWYPMKKDADGNWYTDINSKKLMYEGTACIDVYSTENSKNEYVGGTTFHALKEEVSRNELVVSSEKEGERTLRMYVSKTYKNMNAAVWSEEKGQDDLSWHSLKKISSSLWEVTVPTSVLSGSGLCIIHIYADSNSRYLDGAGIPIEDSEVPKKSMIISGEGRTRMISLTGCGAYDKISVAVWSEKNSQDDLSWTEMKKSADNVWTASYSLSSLNNGGSCNAHFYAGKKAVYTASFIIDEKEVLNDRVSVTGSGKTRTAKVETSRTYGSVRAAVWSDEKGQDDLQWITLKKSNAGWSASFAVSFLKHTGLCHVHFYTGSRYIGAYDFTVSKSDMPSDEISISNGDSFKKISLINPAGGYSSVKVAVWSQTGGQDDVRWISMQKSGNTWTAAVPFRGFAHSGTCYAHIYADNKYAAGGSFTISESDLFKGRWLFGSDSDIDFVQAAINIARDDSIGYGHTWPRTISCAGLVGLSLTYLGYGDFIRGNPLQPDGSRWGYIDLGTYTPGCSWMSVMSDEVGAVWHPGTGGIRSGDILYYDYGYTSNHTGFFIGGNLTVESRGGYGSTDADDTGSEVAVYSNWQTLPWQGYFRILRNFVRYW